MRAARTRTMLAVLVGAEITSASLERKPRLVMPQSPSAPSPRRHLQPQLATELLRLRGGGSPPGKALPVLMARESDLSAERHSSPREGAEQHGAGAPAPSIPEAQAAAAVAAANAGRLFRGRAITVLCLYMSTLITGLLRRTLGSAAPSLVSEGIMSHEQLQDTYLLGYRAFALGKLLAAPLLVLLGNTPTLMLQSSVSSTGASAPSTSSEKKSTCVKPALRSICPIGRQRTV